MFYKTFLYGTIDLEMGLWYYVSITSANLLKDKDAKPEI